MRRLDASHQKKRSRRIVYPSNISVFFAHGKKSMEMAGTHGVGTFVVIDACFQLIRIWDEAVAPGVRYRCHIPIDAKTWRACRAAGSFPPEWVSTFVADRRNVCPVAHVSSAGPDFQSSEASRHLGRNLDLLRQAVRPFRGQ